MADCISPARMDLASSGIPPACIWLPRIGLAYQATRSTVVRSGYGIFYGSLGSFKTTANLAGFSQTTPIQPTQDNGQTFKATLANPFPNGLIAPLGADRRPGNEPRAEHHVLPAGSQDAVCAALVFRRAAGDEGRLRG